MTTLRVEPLAAPPDADVVVPGSKSITNRALVCAALAEGTSELHGIVRADDTEAMWEGLRSLGAAVDLDDAARSATVTGTGGRLRPGPVELDVRESGTTARFLAPVAALGSGRYRIDAAPSMRARPMGDAVGALVALGVTVTEDGQPGHLPFTVEAAGLEGGPVAVPGDVSSQFLSGLLLAGPCARRGLTVEVSTGLVSRPYVAMTGAVMSSFGAAVDHDAGRWVVAPGGYAATRYAVEPDATAASYFFAAAAITGGRVRVEGLGAGSLQGDLAFARVLSRMGAEVDVGESATEVRGTGVLHGVEVDLADLSDTAQTLAAVAVFADSPTRVTGVGFIRRKETDRVAAVVRELRRCGIEADEEADGFVVRPGTPRAATVDPSGDHRMAMSFGLLGLRVPGIEIADAGCVAKTFPRYWEALARLGSGGEVDGG